MTLQSSSQELSKLVKLLSYVLQAFFVQFKHQTDILEIKSTSSLDVFLG